MPEQGVFTVVTEIRADRMEALCGVLEDLDSSLDGEIDRPPIVDFRSFDTVHFARFVVLPEDGAGKRYLVLSTAYDGTRRFHVAELAKRAGAGLCLIYEHCVDFPEAARTAPATLLAYLERNSIRHAALHIGYVGRTVQDIRRENELRRFIEEKLDASRLDERTIESAAAVRRRIIQWVRDGEFRWALEPRALETSPFRIDGVYRSAALVGAVGAALLAGGVAFAVFGGVPGVAVYVGGLAAAAGAAYVVLRRHEESEPAKSDTNVARGLEHAEDEDFTIRNQLTHFVEVKRGAFRRCVLAAVLAAIELRARFQFYKGDLGGIETIHCAYWVLLDGPRRRLLFLSNYDGSWERYLDDFIEEAGGGMTSVWSNTVDFPRAKNLLFDGAQNERVFKAWTREHQVRTVVWYAAKPDVSMRNVLDNSRLRDGLRGSMTEAQAKEWLRLL
jgi:hypothetical protein